MLVAQDQDKELAELLEWIQYAEENGEELDPLLALAEHAETQSTPNPTQNSQKARTSVSSL